MGHKFLKLTAVFFLLLGLDFGTLGLLYWRLPDTMSLNKSGVLVRKSFQNPKQDIKIHLGSANYVRFRQLPDALKGSVVYLEDGRFYEHRGFDFFEIQEALENTALEGRRLRGASTISQQLVKNIYLSSDRSFRRKILEALITIKLEAHVPKWRILELYFNTIDWGENVIGISNAARHYFGKSVSDLSIKESVFLAAIIPNPAVFSRNPTHPRVHRRMLLVLENLYRSGIISLTDYSQAVAEDINL